MNNKNHKRKAIIDDGMNPELVRNAEFDGILQIPKIKPNNNIIIPKSITPFTKIDRDNEAELNAIGFYEMDINFSDILINTNECLDKMRPYAAVITPDCSLYRNAPLSAQITNVYRNRAIGYQAQIQGHYVIPQIRWGSEETYTTKVLPEKVAFLGAPKRSIVAIGTYGCIQSREDKYYFKAGLESMLIELEPTDVLVYGAMPDCVFKDYMNSTNFHRYDDWTTRIKRGTN